MEVNVIMPMLGGGTRMQGCQPTCKPLMRLPDGERFFLRALDSLKNYRINALILVVLPDYFQEFNDLAWQIQERVHTKEGVRIMQHDPTRNPVETLYVGFNRLWMYTNRNLPLFVLDCDIYGEIPSFDPIDFEDGRVFWFPSTAPNKSYIQTVECTGAVRRIAEKEVISDKAVMGAYLFENIPLLRRILGTLRGEEYISQLFGRMLEEHAWVMSSPVASVTNFGTLEELNSLYENH